MLTPEVQRALTSIIDELEGLRWRLDQSLRRQEYLENLADQDGQLPILNRRAFERELGAMIEELSRRGVPGTLIYLYLETYDELRREKGLVMAERALRHLAITVRDSLRKTDVSGHIGGAGIAAALALSHEGGGVTKAWDVIQKVKRVPFVVDGEVVPMTLSVGVHEVGEGETPENVLVAADRNQQHRTVLVAEAREGE